MTETKRARNRHAPKAAAAFTLSGLLIAASAIPAAAAFVEEESADTGSTSQLQVERLADSYVVSNEYLIVEHSADEEALNNLRVGREAEWNLSVSLNPEAFSEDNPDAPVSDNAELRAYLTYDSDFSSEIRVSSDYDESLSDGVPTTISAEPDLPLVDSTNQAGTYQVSVEDSVDITVTVVPGADLEELQEIDLMFSILAGGEFVEPPEDGEDDGEETPPWIEVPLPGGNDEDDDEQTPNPTDEPTEITPPVGTDDGTVGGGDENIGGGSNSNEGSGNDGSVDDGTAGSGDDSVSNQDSPMPPVVSRDNGNGITDGNMGETETESDDNQAEPVEIATGFFNEFSNNIASIAIFFAGLLAMIGALVLRRKELGAPDGK